MSFTHDINLPECGFESDHFGDFYINLHIIVNIKTATISIKEILSGLKSLLKFKYGQTFKVMYRSKPFVTLLMTQNEHNDHLTRNTGTLAAARHSTSFVKSLAQRKPTFDASKSFKELYDDTWTL